MMPMDQARCFDFLFEPEPKRPFSTTAVVFGVNQIDQVGAVPQIRQGITKFVSGDQFPADLAEEFPKGLGEGSGFVHIAC